jgi:tRNA (guanine37-N1)-methyltransferase
MDIHILSLFPRYFEGPFDESILKKAREKEILNIQHVNLRDYAVGKHRRVDERPCGGGPGMILMPVPIQAAIQSVKRPYSHVVYLSPQGVPLTAKKAQELSKKEHLILICGHYEGIDERVIEKEISEEISIGDYVLTNGALAAIVLIDTVSRFIPGVLGDEHSSEMDSFEKGILDWPQYTQPAVFCGESVPKILLDGNHQQIAAWRKEKALSKTRKVRPDLYIKYMAGEPFQWKGRSGRGQVEILLQVPEWRESVRFYKKILEFPLLFLSEQQAVFELEGTCLTLRQGEMSTVPSILLKLKLANQMLLERLAVRLLRAGQRIEKRQIKAGEMSFTDNSGYCWYVHCPQEEE